MADPVDPDKPDTREPSGRPDDILAGSALRSPLGFADSTLSAFDMLQQGVSGTAGSIAGVSNISRNNAKDKEEEAKKREAAANALINSLQQEWDVLEGEINALAKDLIDDDPKRQALWDSRQALRKEYFEIQQRFQDLAENRALLTQDVNNIISQNNAAIDALLPIDKEAVQAFLAKRRVENNLVILDEKIPGDPADRPPPVVYQEEGSGRYYVKNAQGETLYVDEMANAEALLYDINKQINGSRTKHELGDSAGLREQEWLEANRNFYAHHDSKVFPILEDLDNPKNDRIKRIQEIDREMALLQQRSEAISREMEDIDRQLADTLDHEKILELIKEKQAQQDELRRIQDKQKELGQRVTDVREEIQHAATLAEKIAQLRPKNIMDLYESIPANLRHLLTRTQAAVEDATKEVEALKQKIDNTDFERQQRFAQTEITIEQAKEKIPDLIKEHGDALKALEEAIHTNADPQKISELKSHLNSLRIVLKNEIQNYTFFESTHELDGLLIDRKQDLDEITKNLEMLRQQFATLGADASPVEIDITRDAINNLRMTMWEELESLKVTENAYTRLMQALYEGVEYVLDNDGNPVRKLDEQGNAIPLTEKFWAAIQKDLDLSDQQIANLKESSIQNEQVVNLKTSEDLQRYAETHDAWTEDDHCDHLDLTPQDKSKILQLTQDVLAEAESDKIPVERFEEILREKGASASPQLCAQIKARVEAQSVRITGDAGNPLVTVGQEIAIEEEFPEGLVVTAASPATSTSFASTMDGSKSSLSAKSAFTAAANPAEQAPAPTTTPAPAPAAPATGVSAGIGAST